MEEKVDTEKEQSGRMEWTGGMEATLEATYAEDFRKWRTIKGM